MSVLETVISVIAPHECMGCLAEGSLLCASCILNLRSAPAFGHSLHSLAGIASVTPYEGAAKDLVWLLKSKGAKSAAKAMAFAMARLTAEEYLLVPVPTASGHVRQRGYDQATLLARYLSRFTGQPYFGCLRRVGQVHQVGASREQRLRQLHGAYLLKKPRLIRGAKVMLVDDVVTTGATLEAASRVLLEAGAAEVRAVTFAQTP